MPSDGNRLVGFQLGRHLQTRKPLRLLTVGTGAALRAEDVKQGCQCRGELLSIDQIVEETVIYVGLGGVNVSGNGAHRDLFHGLQWSKANKRTGLGEDQVRQVGETGVSLTCGRVGQHHDKGHPLLPEPVGCRHRLGHLHQREHTLLYACASATDEGHDR